MGAGGHSSCEPESAALRIEAKSTMQDQGVTVGDLVQQAELQLSDEQRRFLSARLKCFAAEGNRLLEAKRAAVARLKHSERIMAAVEARIDVVGEQAEELLTALEALAGAVERQDRLPNLLATAYAHAQKLIKKYGPSDPVEGE